MFLFINPTQKNSITLKLFIGDTSITHVHEGDYKLTEKLLFFVDQILNEGDLVAKDLEGIILAVGPGSYTALRLACVVVNTLAQVQGILVYGDTLENLTTDESIREACSKVNSTILSPQYAGEPNITIPK
jgi:tRNA A37 threonylcarbamoyladenosine modification protein TsaB